MPKESSRLFGLGRATLRGVKKCPKCGTPNGTRGLCCKNKSCNVVFKEAGGRKKFSTEACRLETGTSTQVFSVRVRDKGPDYRGFVQLPMAQSGVTSDSVMKETSALCFVEPCQRNFNASILQCHEHNGQINPVICSHIRAALKCFSEAIPLQLNTSILDALNINPDMKKEVWSLVTDTLGPVVQRVSKFTMAVRCKASPKHPLGYLHFSFNFTSRGDPDNQFSCTCSTFKENAKQKRGEDAGRCPHFYACLCAFVNSESLCEEFSQYIRLEIPLTQQSCVAEPCEVFDLDTTGQGDSELSQILNNPECRVEVFREEVNNILADNIAEDAIIFSTVDDMDNRSMASLKVSMDSEGLSFPLDTLEDIATAPEPETLIPTQLDLTGTAPLDALNTPLDLASLPNMLELSYTDGAPLLLETIIEPDVVISEGAAKQPPKRKHGPVKTNNAAMNFKEWLGTVTESINQHMHYQFDGKPTPLVFHVPQKFFERLKDRIVTVRKKKGPTSVTTFTRKDSIPMGTFTKYTWTLSNIMHVKYVFDTPYMPLQIIKTFVKNKDGTFAPSENVVECPEQNKSSQPLLKPAQYKTFIRVGLTCREQLEPTPFKIEWIPDVLPLSHIGELRIEFEFGHLHPQPNIKR